MKAMLMVWLAACAATAMAQNVDSSHGIGRVENDHEDSSPYLARTPYTLFWVVDAKYKLYGKSDPTVKFESYLAGLFVYDVATGKLITSTENNPSLSGSMKVPVAGRHRIKVFCTGPLTLSFTEDKTALEAAARRGELRDGMTLEESRAVSNTAKNEKVAALKNAVIKQLEANRGTIGEEAITAFRMDAERAAQLASSPEDFNNRYRELSNNTLAGLKGTQAGSRVAGPPATSSWNGMGLPPGMRKAAK